MVEKNMSGQEKSFKIAPSILAADFSVLKDEIDSVSSADYLHIDVMDGMFVPNISLGVPVIKSIRPVTNLIFDVHLMIENPRRYIKNFVDAGADIITIHAEASDDLKNDINMIKSLNKKAAVAIKPNTPVDLVYDVLESLDMVLIMSVEPGFGGQKFIESTLEKAQQIKKVIDESNLDIDIEMDGGINLDNIKDVVKSGVNIAVIGSDLFNSHNRVDKINKFRYKISF